MTKLRISTDLALPLEATTQAIGIVAKRRAGKSYLGRRLCEQLLKAGQQVAIIDPKGDQWGIRSSADGKSPGLPVVILGGEHGDVPLEAGAGEIVAKLVIEEQVSALLDLSQFRKHEVATFMTHFLENLYRLKAREAYRTPLMVVIDEADAIAPQKPQRGEERMLGAAEDIVRRGGQRGLGCTLITQRTAVLNKNVLTQCQVLIALRTIAPQDLDAMGAWVDVHGTDEERTTLMESLPSLPVGDAWVWSPGWPTTDGIFKRIHVLPIETFDSGATPKSGEKRVEPKNLADVDLGALTRQMAATIEKAKADDPKELRRQVAEAQREIERLRRDTIDPTTIAQIEADGYERARIEAMETTHSIVRGELSRYNRLLESAQELMQSVARSYELSRNLTTVVVENGESRLREAAKPVVDKDEFGLRRPFRPAVAPSAPSAPRAVITGNGAVEANPSQQKILNALALMERIGAPNKRVNVAFFSGYSVGGRFNRLVGELNTAGLVAYPDNGSIALTEEGRTLADAGAAPVSTREQLHELWLGKLNPSQAKILRVLLDVYPEDISRAQLAGVASYEVGGRFNRLVGELKTLGAIAYPREGAVAASDVLFPRGLR